MPIRIPDLLPAVDLLNGENIFVMTETRAMHQDVRPLKVLLLNLMPKKIETENQLIRMLSNSPLQIDFELLRNDNTESKNTPIAHLNSFYRDFEDIKENHYDGLIITCAPLGRTPWEQVRYKDEITEIINWSQEHVTSTMFLCWAVEAALNIFYDLPKNLREEKLSGVYQHKTRHKHETLTRGFDDYFKALSANDQFASKIKAPTSTGAQATGGQGQHAVTPHRSKMSATEKRAYQQEHGQEAFLKLPK